MSMGLISRIGPQILRQWRLSKVISLVGKPLAINKATNRRLKPHMLVCELK